MTIDDKISQVFDVEPLDKKIDNENQFPAIQENKVETDYDYARKNIKDLISAGSSAVGSLVEIAKASEHPRAFEVFSTLIKNLSDLNKDLLDIQSKNNQLIGATSKKDSSTEGINVNQAVFVGSTRDLIQMIKKEENNG